MIWVTNVFNIFHWICISIWVQIQFNEQKMYKIEYLLQKWRTIGWLWALPCKAYSIINQHFLNTVQQQQQHHGHVLRTWLSLYGSKGMCHTDVNLLFTFQIWMTEQGERRINQPLCDQAGEKEWCVGEGRLFRATCWTVRSTKGYLDWRKPSHTAFQLIHLFTISFSVNYIL